MRIRKNTEQLKGKRLKKLDLQKDEAPFVWSRNQLVAVDQLEKGQKIIEDYRCKIELMTAWCDLNENLIGHIKIFLEDEAQNNAWMSTVGEGMVVDSSRTFEETFIHQYQENITAIIFGKNQDKVNEKLNQVFI